MVLIFDILYAIIIHKGGIQREKLSLKTVGSERTMDQTMKNIFKNYAIGSIACCAMGIALLVNPHIITDVLNTAIGIILIVWGVLGAGKCISAHSGSQDSDINIFSLIGHIALIAAGVFVFRHTNMLEKILMGALGIYLICSGLPKLLDSLRIRNELHSQWKKPFITSCVTVLLGLTVLIVPALLPSLMMRAVGVLLIAGGIGNFIGGHSSSRVLSGIREKHELRYGRPAVPNGSVIDVEMYDEGGK